MTARDIDTATGDLLASLDEGVLTLTLNRPEARNAMSPAMVDALAGQLAWAELEPSVKCVVLTGAGKGFCAGGDVKGMAARGDGTVGDNTIDGAIHLQRVKQHAAAGKSSNGPRSRVGWVDAEGGLMTARDIDTATGDLLASLDEGVLTLTLNRPEARNAMSPAMVDALAGQLAWAELEPSVKCVVLTGAGKGFCAGGDVKGMAARGDGTVGDNTIDGAIHLQRVKQRATAGKLFKMPKPTIASLPGAAAGAGLSLALACDLRIMARTAIMTTAFARVGFSGDYGGTYFLTQLVGSAKARELYYLSDRVSADEALRLGLANWVCEADELAAKTREIAGRLAQGPTVAYRYMKENLNRAMAGDVDNCLDLEATHHIHCGQTEDHREATKAFVEKREPVFKGQ